MWSVTIRAKEQIKTTTLQFFQRHRKKFNYALGTLSSLLIVLTIHHINLYNYTAHVSPYKFSAFDLAQPLDGVVDDVSTIFGDAPKMDGRGLLVDRKDSTDNIRDPFFSMNITETDIEDTNVELPPTLKNYRNPCWLELVPGQWSYKDSFFYRYYRLYPENQPPQQWEDVYSRLDELIQERKHVTPNQLGWRVRCFPYFLLIGFTKSGTSDLRRSLSKLPDFVPGIIKEPKFWNKIRLEGYLGADVLPRVTLSDYLDLYDKAAEELRHYVNVTTASDVYHPGIIGDFDPQTIWQLPNWEKIKGNELKDEPRYTTAHHLYGIRPQTRLIVLMRDPVERAFSHYRFFKARKHGTRVIYADKLHEDFHRAIKKLNNCFKEKSVRACAYFPWKSDPITMRSLTVSLYDVYIRDWLNVFPREQFLFICSENYFQDRMTVIRKIVDFLGIDNDIPRSLMLKISDLRIVNPSAKTGMGNDTRAMLEKFFTPYNNKLADILEDDHFVWNYH